jgi:hypothetical protein
MSWTLVRMMLPYRLTMAIHCFVGGAAGRVWDYVEDMFVQSTTRLSEDSHPGDVRYGTEVRKPTHDLCPLTL